MLEFNILPQEIDNMTLNQIFLYFDEVEENKNNPHLSLAEFVRMEKEALKKGHK